MSPVSFTVSSIQGMWFLTWRRVPQNPQLGSVPLIPIIICFRVLEDTLDSRHIALVPSLNHVWLFKTIACQAPLSSKISWSLLKFMSIGSMILSKMSSSVVPFSSCPPSFPASGSFPMSWLFASGGQITGASASTSVLPMNVQGWFPLGLIYLISLLSKGLSRVYSSTTVWKHQLFGIQPRKSKGEGKQLCIQGKGRKRDVYFSYKEYARNKECIFVKEKRVVISKVKWLIVLE